MTKKISIEELFDWNVDYILNHRLSDDVISIAGIKTKENEIFVEFPEWAGYYISQYGRAISTKEKTPKLLKQEPGGTHKDYVYYKFSDKQSNREPRTIGVHRAVAEVFCPNFWKTGVKLETHHLDRIRDNNYFQNVILLPVNLHHALHNIKKIVLFKNGKIIEYKNPLDLVRDTDLTLEEIILANKDKKNKPLKSTGGYTVFDLKGHMIGFKYYPASEKAKKN